MSSGEVTFAPNSRGYAAVMSSARCGSVLDSAAANVAARATAAAKHGTYGTATAEAFGDRMVALVHTDDFMAMLDQSHRNTLGKAIS